MKAENIKQLVQEAVKFQSLIPVRAYFKGEDDTHVHLKMPLVNNGKKFHQQCKIPKQLVYYTFNDHKKKEATMPDELLFMLIPLGVWQLHFDYQPGSTWTCPQHFQINTSINGN